MTKSTNTINVVKSYRAGDVVLDSFPNTPSFGAYVFNPTLLSEWYSYAGLYDEYKLVKVKVVFENKFTSNPMVSASDPLAASGSYSLYNNRFYTYFDVNDNSVPVSLNYFYNRNGVKATKFNRTHTRIIYPRILQDIDDGPTGTQILSKNEWLSTATPCTNYTGIKWGAEEWFTATNPMLTPLAYNLYFTFYLQFRKPQ